MTERELCVAGLRERYRRGVARPMRILEKALGRANSNAGRNVYLAQDAGWSRGEAERLRIEDFEGKALWGVPVSLKDCFDLEGYVTTCGAKVLQAARGMAVTGFGCGGAAAGVWRGDYGEDAHAAAGVWDYG